MSQNRPPTLLTVASSGSLKPTDPITLVDRTTRSEVENPTSSEPTSTPTTPAADAGLYKRLTQQSNFSESVRREISRQKYARYGQDRYHTDELDDATATMGPHADTIGGMLAPPRQEQSPAASSSSLNSAQQQNYLERAQTRAKTLWRRSKKNMGGRKNEEDSVVDILYENQRGAFLFGIPKYSASSLLPSDPKPWQNGQFRSSPVDIRNAQVPDPSWQWVWRSWYVDMSRDVDEEGWEYSFAFVGRGGRTFAWHGNHPWFHSFVRRRRWLRMRKRRPAAIHPKEQAHNLTADYFTIHTKNKRPTSLSDSRAGSTTIANVLARAAEDAEADVEDMEIANIADLFLALRRASLDRQKLAAVRKFVDAGGDELTYLGQRMNEIMGCLWYQTSRRQLLGQLIARHDEAQHVKDDLASHDQQNDDEAARNRHGRDARSADYLLQAIHAADEYVKKLEFESDIKNVTSSSRNNNNNTTHTEDGHPEPSFKNKQPAKEGVGELHRHPEHSDPPSDGASRKSSVWFDAASRTSAPDSQTTSSSVAASHAADDDGNAKQPDSDEVYTTAAESSSELSRRGVGVGGKWKGKAKASDLDGVPEDDDMAAAQVTNGASDAEIPAADRSIERYAETTRGRDARLALIHEDGDLKEVPPESEIE